MAALAAGLTVLGLATRDLVVHGPPSGWQLTFVAVFGIMAFVSWLRPLIVYVVDQSEAIHLDEAFLVILLLLVPAWWTVVTFAVATALAQGIMRRPLVKSVFNFGQLLASVGAAVAVFGAFGQPGAVSYVDVAAAISASVVFFLVNTAAIALMLSATGVGPRAALLDALDIRLVLDFGGVGVAIAVSLLLQADRSALPVAIVPLLVLRYALGGFFRARHNETRLEGLFQATLDANASVGRAQDGVTAGLLGSARALLRCTEADLVEQPSEKADLRAPVSLGGKSLWLTVSGRSRTEPFDRADQGLLDALAAVGTSALSNAALYQQSQRQRQHLAAITSSLGEGVCALDRSGRVTFMNQAAARMLGWEYSDGLDDEQLLMGPGTGAPAPDFLWATAMRTVATGEPTATYNTRFWRADGSSIEVACTVAPIVGEDARSGAVLVFRDLSQQKQMAELAHQASHDSLTGLPNRRQFLDDLGDALGGPAGPGGEHAVLFVDIDRFKDINDSLGHNSGDYLLIMMANRMKKALRPSDRLARFGGDEFTVLLEGVGDVEVATRIAQRLIDSVRAPVRFPDGHEVVVNLSIGIALAPPGRSPEDVIRDADAAMYEAKAGGRTGSYRVFQAQGTGPRPSARTELEVDLRQALERDEFDVYYQPVFSIPERRMVSVEALVRWKHPGRGLMLPRKFIGLAEETGVIYDIGRLVLGRVCRQAQQWREHFGTAMVYSLNLSARQFEGTDLLDAVGDVLRTTGVDPAQLCFEITEQLMLHQAHETHEVLVALRALGSRVAIDDFGTGHSALGYLATFPIDVIKVDQSLVEGVEADAVKSAVVSAALRMGEAIGCTTVVEGVETQAQVNHLRLLGCTLAQGFYFARPMPARRLEDLFGPGRQLAPPSAPAWRRVAKPATLALSPS